MDVADGVAPPPAAWVSHVGRLLDLAVNLPAALLVVTEMVVLFSGVVARYVFRAPLVWSDELATTLFLWLAMLGSVVALRRNEHMRMTALVSRARPAARAVLDVIAVCVPVGFLGLMILPGFDFAGDEGFVTTPGLEISGTWAAAAFPVGALLMLLVALLRLARVGRPLLVAGALALVLAIAGGFVVAAPWLHPLGNYNRLIFFVFLVGDMAAIAPVLFPEMRAREAKPGELLALLAATGAQTETIPPSLVLITIGSVTGVSIAALFTGGMLPGLLLGLVLCLVFRLRLWRQAEREVLPPRAAPRVVRVFIYRRFDLRRILPMLVETASLSGAILIIIGAATGMSWALTQSGFSHALAVMMGALPGGKVGFLTVSILAFVVLGSVLECIPSIVLSGRCCSRSPAAWG